MKKVILSMAGLLAATAFAPEASAVPSFARQTGMACDACHFQSYPALNSFGRAFKSSGYTMIGTEGKIEGENGLSIPAVLNASLYTQLRYNKTNGKENGPDATAGSKNSGRFDFPDEMALFAAGRVSENIGMLTEIATGPAGTAVANFKMPFVFDAGSMKISAIPFWSDGNGAAAGYDLFATGSNASGRVTENGQGYSAAMYMGSTNNPAPGGQTLGVALVVSNEAFHVNLTPYAGASGNTAQFGGRYIRAGWTPSFDGWDVGLGIQNWSGKSLKGQPGYDVESKLTVIDGQVQGEVSGMPLGVYASYGTAPASAANITASGGGANIYNNGTNTKTAFGVLADLWVIPHTLGVQLGFMRAKTGMNQSGVVGANESDNSYTLGARYKIRQNVKLGVAYTKFSGTAYDIGGSGGTNADDTSNVMATPVAGVNNADARRGNNRLTVILSAGF